MSTYSLSGSGTHALTASTTGLHVTITTPSSVGGSGRSNPVAKYDQGLIRFSDGTGYWSPVPILGGPQFIPVPANATSIGYALIGGAVVSVTEVIGGTVFFSGGSGSLAALSDVALASLSDGQVLQYVAAASKWENVTPSAGATATAANLGADVGISSVGPFFSGPSVTLAAGRWLLIGQAVIQCGGATTVSWRFNDGTNTSSATSYATSGTSATGSSSSLVVNLTATTTITLEANSTFSGCTLKASAATVGMSKARTSIAAYPIS